MKTDAITCNMKKVLTFMSKCASNLSHRSLSYLSVISKIIDICAKLKFAFRLKKYLLLFYEDAVTGDI